MFANSLIMCRTFQTGKQVPVSAMQAEKNIDSNQEEVTHELVTPRDWIRWGASRFNEAGLFFGHGTDNALDEAAYLVLHALHLPLDLPENYFDARLLPGERRCAQAMIEERVKSRRPAAYITGVAWFADLEFEVDEHVLVPRSPMAELIEDEFEPWLGGLSPLRILDLGTGCGAIAIACAHAFPQAQVDGVDISDGALAVARRNIERHGMEGRVTVFHSDFFDDVPEGRYDLIVANPPYVDAEALDRLSAEYQQEPRVALVGQDKGLEPALKILNDAPRFLSPDGLLALEVGTNAEALAERTPGLELIWVDLEYGGEGICTVSARDLSEYAVSREG